MTELERAYWAGVFDYRGRIFMRMIHGHWTPQIIIRNKEREPLEPLVKFFKGRIAYGQIDKTYTWQRTTFSCREVVRILSPYMNNHKEVIAQVLAWQPANRIKRRTSEVVFKPTLALVKGKAMNHEVNGELLNRRLCKVG